MGRMAFGGGTLQVAVTMLVVTLGMSGHSSAPGYCHRAPGVDGELLYTGCG